MPFWCSFISDLLHVHFPINTSASKNCLMILPTSFGTLSLKTMPSFSFPVNFCFSAYKHCDFSQLTKSADLSPACLGNFFFCSSLHLNLSLLVLWTRQIKIWSCTGIKVWFWYPELFKKWMLLNPLKFNKLHWALKFNSSMAVTILSKQLLQFPRDGCSWEFNRNSWCCSHGSGQYCVASFDFDAFNKNVANIQNYS